MYGGNVTIVTHNNSLSIIKKVTQQSLKVLLTFHKK